MTPPQNNPYQMTPQQAAPKNGGIRKWVLIAVAVLVVFGFISAMGGEDEKTTGTANVAEAANAPADEAIVDDSVNDSGENSDLPRDFTAALSQAENYSDMMHMSRQGIYDQLVSEYGGQFAPEAAQYAVDNLQADYQQNALESAKNYMDTMPMSTDALYDQLISEYGSQFTPEEAQYAIDNLDG